MTNRLKTGIVLAMAGAAEACANAEVTWPSEFWTQITNSMAIPSGTQIGTGTASFSIASPCRTSRASNETWLKSRKPGLIIVFN